MLSMMKFIFLISSLCVITNATPWSPLINANFDDLWDIFKKEYGKAYTEETEYVRRRVWEANLDTIRKHNVLYDLGKRKYTLGINEFADLTHDEFKRIYLKYGPVVLPANVTRVSNEGLGVSVPDSVNWVKKGYVTEVKNQGQCGSCWAFSTTGSMEGQQFRKKKKLISLSEQQLVDCSSDYGNEGCNGGLMDYAFKYIMKYGLEKEDDYPYTAQDGSCQYSRRKAVSKCKKFKDVTSGSEKSLTEAVAKVGPISVGIDASQPSFQLYSGGVYDEENCSSTRLDHGVLVVGYDTDEDSDEKYWLVKNSWGRSWGMKGYIKMSRDKDNQCGIATLASYPLM